MKKLLLCVVMILLTKQYLYSQWNLIHNHDSGLTAIDAVNKDTVYAVGTHTAIRTLDGGITWSDINYNLDSLWLTDVEFPTPKTGYILGWPSILKTEDYGNTWNKVLTDSSGNYIELEFVNQDTGWIIRTGDIILRTYNGGLTWDYHEPETIMLTDIDMVNHEIGYITHMAGMIRTTDGGDTWDEINENIGGSQCCSFITSDTGYIGMQFGVALTTDAGDNWIYRPSQTLVGGLGRSQLQFLNQDTGYYAGYDAMASAGTLATTTNGGIDWMETRGKYQDIDMFDSETGYCIKFTGEIYKTSNGGILVGKEENINMYSINIYPNPATTYVTLYNPHYSLKLHTLRGQLVLTSSTGEPEISLEGIAPGVYVATIMEGEKVIGREKFVVR